MSDKPVGEAWLNLQEQMTPIIEATAGHRHRLEAMGFSPSVSEMMAADFHRHLLSMAFKKRESA
jgi:hypothetical protein